MSYAGVYGDSDTCKHGGYTPNCTQCILDHQAATGKRDGQGVVHSDNGAGYCVGCPKAPTGMCTTLVVHCPVLRIPEELATQFKQDKDRLIQRAEVNVIRARQQLRRAEKALEAAKNS